MKSTNQDGLKDGRRMRVTGDNHPGTLPADFFKEFSHSYRSAINQIAAQTQHFISIAGRTLCLSFAGRGLERLVMPALAHLISSSQSHPSLTIFIWDSESTKAALPRIPFVSEDLSLREGYLISAENIRAYFSLGKFSTQYSFLNTFRREAFFCVPGPEHLSAADHAAPLRVIFNWWLKSQGLQMLHAAAVGTAQGGVLLAGKGGSGKSSTALACLESDLGYAADDYAAVSLTPPYKGYSLYNSARWHKSGTPKFLKLFSQTKGATASENQKGHLFVADIYPEKILKEFFLQAVLFPEISAQNIRARLSVLSPADALRRLAPSTLLQMAGARQDDFGAIARLVKEVSAYRFELCDDAASLSRAISELIAAKIKEIRHD